jgi:hypothetical protein
VGVVEVHVTGSTGSLSVESRPPPEEVRYLRLQHVGAVDAILAAAEVLIDTPIDLVSIFSWRLGE